MGMLKQEIWTYEDILKEGVAPSGPTFEDFVKAQGDDDVDSKPVAPKRPVARPRRTASFQDFMEAQPDDD
jgi:hypothetical protein